MNQLSFTALMVATLLVAASILFIPAKKYRWIPLLGISLLFYWWVSGPKLILLALYSLFIFGAGLLIGNLGKEKKRHFMVVLLVTGSLLPLIFSKLLPLFPILRDNIFFAERIEYVLATGTVELIGISFFVFNAISYLVDIRRGYIEPTTNFFLLLLYLVFYPVIYSGPLHRAKELMRQFLNNIHFSIENGRLAFRLLLMGFFKNLVLAPRISYITHELERNGTGLYVVLQGFCFFFYLYCVFSSYVDIAKGIGKIMGISIAENFRNRVYASSSRQQFWQGWHMTLNNWFRDYVFFPLAKKRRTRQWMRICTLVTFILIGLWHGLSFKFALWGVLNGCWIIAEQEWKGKIDFIPAKYKRWAGILYHLSIASFLALLFSSSSVLTTLDRLFSPTGILNGIPPKTIFIQLLISAAMFAAMDWLYRKAGDKHVEVWLGTRGPWFRWSIYIVLLFSILLLGQEWVFDNYYFQF